MDNINVSAENRGDFSIYNGEILLADRLNAEEALFFLRFFQASIIFIESGVDLRTIAKRYSERDSTAAA